MNFKFVALCICGKWETAVLDIFLYRKKTLSYLYNIIGDIYSPRRQAPLGMPSLSSQSTPCRAKYNQEVNSDWRIKMAHSTSNSNFKRSATMTGIVKGQRRDVQKTKTHVRCAQLGHPPFLTLAR